MIDIPLLYVRYLEQKVEFLKKQVDSPINRYDKGITLTAFPTYESWKEDLLKEMRPTTPLSERNHPMV